MNMKKNMLLILSFILLFNFIFIDNIIVNAAPIKLNRTSLTMEYKEGYYLKLNTIYLNHQEAKDMEKVLMDYITM